MRKLLLWLVTGFVLFFLVAPIFVIVPLSFSSGSLLTYPLPGFSLQWYERLFTDAQWLAAIRNSFTVAIATTVVATLLGIPAAIAFSWGKVPFRPFVMALVMSPVIVPVIIVAVGVYFAFAPLGLVNNKFGLVLAHSVLAIPFVIITVSATLEGFDRGLLRAAASLGASAIRTFAKVTLPIVLPGVASGSLFAFVTSFDEVVVALFLTGPEQRTLPVQMFEGIREYINPLITAVATLFVAMAAVLLVTIELIRRRNERLQTRS